MNTYPRVGIHLPDYRLTLMSEHFTLQNLTGGKFSLSWRSIYDAGTWTSLLPLLTNRVYLHCVFLDSKFPRGDSSRVILESSHVSILRWDLDPKSDASKSGNAGYVP